MDSYKLFSTLFLSTLICFIFFFYPFYASRSLWIIA